MPTIVVRTALRWPVGRGLVDFVDSSKPDDRPGASVSRFNLCKSVRMSAAFWYRSLRSFSSAFVDDLFQLRRELQDSVETGARALDSGSHHGSRPLCFRRKAGRPVAIS